MCLMVFSDVSAQNDKHYAKKSTPLLNLRMVQMYDGGIPTVLCIVLSVS